MKPSTNYTGGASESSSLLPDPTSTGPNTVAVTQWRLGLSLAVVSGLLFTANNFLIQFYDVNAFEILMVRSVLQSIVLGMIAANSEGNLLPTTWMARIFVVAQALLGGFRLYFNFTCLAFMPLGDALTLIFTEPLFTVILSFIFLRIAISVWKVLLSAGLLTGMVLCIQPPFLFPSKMVVDIVTNVTDNLGNTETLVHEEALTQPSGYFYGVMMALSCAVCGSLCNIVINKCEGVSSTALVFYTGLSGVLISVVGVSLEQSEDLMLSSMESLTPTSWSLMLLISAVGVAGYLCMTQALKAVTPTSVSVLRALEIILAYMCQILVMGEFPNMICMFGAMLVMMSVIGIAIEEKLTVNRSEALSNPYENV